MKDRNSKEDEVWVPLKQGGLLWDRYEVSNYGRVWNIINDFEVGQQLRGKPQYHYVNLRLETGVVKGRRVNNIMGWSFLGDPPTKKHTVDHIDRDKLNNYLPNLRWATKKEQMINRDSVVVCEDGENLNTKIRNYCETYGETFKKCYSQLTTLYRMYNDFHKVIEHRQNFVKYGNISNRTVTVKSSNTYKIIDLANMFNLDIEELNNLLNQGLTFEDYVKGFIQPPPTLREYPHSLEYKGIWYPNKECLVNHRGKYGLDCFRQRLKEGMSIEKALTYDRHENSLIEQCNKLRVSHNRVLKLIEQGTSVEGALSSTKPLRVIKHNINGITKRNTDWYKHFGFNKPRSVNSYNCKNKNFRETLEHFGVDTSSMEIYPCDGEFVMYDKPL
jgi:hypothetical protein